MHYNVLHDIVLDILHLFEVNTSLPYSNRFLPFLDLKIILVLYSNLFSLNKCLSISILV